MENINNYLESWRTFYGVLAGSSATLIGLIFLAVSLHIDKFNRAKEHEPRQIAWQTFINFFWVFTIGIIFLLPGLTRLSLGIIIIVLGVTGTIISARRWIKARRHLTTTRALIAFVPLFICYISLSISGILTITWSENALIIIAPVMVFLIGISVRDAWNLLISGQTHENLNH